MHFEGRKSISEVYSYLKGADIVVLASRSEGLPNALLEGMACGCVAVKRIESEDEGQIGGRCRKRKGSAFVRRAAEAPLEQVLSRSPSPASTQV